MKDIYVLSCEKIANGGGIYRFRYSKKIICEKAGYLPCDKPMYAVINGGRLHILLRSPYKQNRNSGYFSCSTDLLDCSSIQDTLGVCACHLAVDKDVYVANYLSSNIVMNCEKSVLHAGKGINQERQEAPHPHFAGFSPDKKYVLCCDLGLDSIFVYDRKLNPVSRTKVLDGYGVRHMIFSADGKYVYAANEMIPSVSIFKYHEGNLIHIQTVALECRDKSSTAAAIKQDVSTGLVYVSVRGENVLFCLEMRDDEVKFIQRIDCGGDSPRDFAVFEDYIVCVNENTDNVVWIDKNTFKIKKEVTIPHPLCVL